MEVTGICCDNDIKYIHRAIRWSVLKMQQAMHKYKLVEKAYRKVLLAAFLVAYDLDKNWWLSTTKVTVKCIQEQATKAQREGGRG